VLESVGVSENNSCEGRSSARVVNDFLDDSLHVPFSLGEVEGPELGWCDPLGEMRPENGAASLSLGYR